MHQQQAFDRVSIKEVKRPISDQVILEKDIKDKLKDLRDNGIKDWPIRKI